MDDRCKITIPVVRYNRPPTPMKIMIGKMVYIAKKRLERWLSALEKELGEKDSIRMVSFKRWEDKVIVEYRVERGTGPYKISEKRGG